MQLILLCIAIVIAGATFLLPLPASWHGSWRAFHLPLFLSGAMASVYISAAILFLTSMRDYKAKLRMTYLMISIGIVANALGTLQLAIINAFNLIETPWAQSGGVIVPFMLSGIALYAGMRQLAHLVEAKTIFAKASIILPAVLVLSIASIFLPHVASNTPEIATDISNAILVWVGLLDLAAALIALKLRTHVGAHYTNAIAWMFIALVGSSIVVAAAFIAALIAPVSGSVDAIDVYVNVASVLVGLLYIQAGYAFHKTRDY